MNKDKAQYFVDVELNRILTNSVLRIEKVVHIATTESDITLGNSIDGIADELIRTANSLKSAVEDFRDVKMSDL